ncbi:hypothetical protein TREES_T100000729 [Tupaia chinensis]|uniref:Uncharacterized protein n=1 Tax=Tupaia chinensis TaxID=246437 RepID=L9KIM4_TUPCH|nr:hypothetical protein TREES_T100000729 [Tupaia chinensis]
MTSTHGWGRKARPVPSVSHLACRGDGKPSFETENTYERNRTHFMSSLGTVPLLPQRTTRSLRFGASAEGEAAGEERCIWGGLTGSLASQLRMSHCQQPGAEPRGGTVGGRQPDAGTPSEFSTLDSTTSRSRLSPAPPRRRCFRSAARCAPNPRSHTCRCFLRAALDPAHWLWISEKQPELQLRHLRPAPGVEP